MSAIGIGKFGLGAATAAALVGLVAGCSSSPSKPAAAPASTAAAAASAPQSASAAGGSASTLKTMSTSIGTVLVDPSSGHTVYELVGDTAAKPTCTGGCLAIWPAVMANGTQVVVNGHPAFTFVEDTAAGQTKGQNVTDQYGQWLALDASGNPISAPAAGSSAPSQSPSATSQAPSGGGAAF